MGKLDPLQRLLPPIVEAMVACRDRTFIEASDIGQHVSLFRTERTALIKLLASETERQTGGKLSIRDIPAAYFNGTAYRTAALRIVLCSTRYRRRGPYVALPAADELVYAITISVNPQQGLQVSKVNVKKKRKRR